MALVKDIQDRVREVAYLMWESAGRQHGMAMEYWLAAERDVISTMQSATERMMPGQPRSGAEDAGAQAGEAAVALPPAEPAPAVGEAEPVSQASEAVVEAIPAVVEASEAAGSTARAAKAAAKPTRRATARPKKTPPAGN